jgi:hypothetical protein
MPGIKHLPANRLALTLLLVSAALLLMGLTAPVSGPVNTLILWLVGALVLLGVWVALALEAFRRYFTPGGGRPEDP